MTVSKEFMDFETYIKKHLQEEVVNHDVDTSGDCAPNNLSWIDYWKSKTNNRFFATEYPTCPSCRKQVHADEFVGAHVVDVYNNKYICPTCDTCNKTYKGDKAKTYWFKVKKYLLLPITR